MWKSAIAAIGLSALLLVALAQDDAASEAESQAFERGRTLYDSMCYQCHGDEGGGLLGSFPELEGNDNLQSLALIVNNVSQGQGNMPAFPLLDAAEIAAVATYVRTAWGNDYGAVEPAEVESVLSDIGAEADARATSIWDGVYTDAQATRGRDTFTGQCSRCHGTRGDGQEGRAADAPPAPSLVGSALFEDWGGAPVAVWHQFTSTTMPINNPGALSAQEYTDAFTYLLQISGVPAGDDELPAGPEALQTIVIEAEPEGSNP
jgi:mono/diheme cytochrome c family protein